MATVLVVDDSTVERLRAGALLERRGIQVVQAANGREALEALTQSPPDLVVTDLQMPEMDGLELVERVRTTYPALPVVLMTAHGSEDIAVQALRRGASSYVPKRFLARDLADTAENLLGLVRAAREQQRVLECLVQTESRFVLHSDSALITPLVGYLQANLERMKLCDAQTRLRVTVALREALVNAIEHGNLELKSELKETSHQSFHLLLEQRRQLSPYRDRKVHVQARESLEEVVYIIRDEGPGFDPNNLPDPLDPANLERCSGRGILLIRTFMDEVYFNDTGNEITLVKRRTG